MRAPDWGLGMTQRHLWIGVCGTVALGAALAAAPRSKSLAQFDAGFAQCEKNYPDMRGQGDQAYASVYRLKLDDTLRATLDETRRSASYKDERRRAAKNLAKSTGASDVTERLQLQRQALQREINKTAAQARR
jgi:hypothetical protein